MKEELRKKFYIKFGSTSYVTAKIVWAKRVKGNKNVNSVFAKTNVKTFMNYVYRELLLHS